MSDIYTEHYADPTRNGFKIAEREDYICPKCGDIKTIRKDMPYTCECGEKKEEK